MSLAAPSVIAAAFAPSAAARQVLVDALATVPSLVPSTTAPVTPAAYCAWPKWTLSEYTGARLGSPADHEYDVLVLLPNAEASDTTAKADELLGQVVAALWSVAQVTTAQPASVTFDGQQSMPALQIHVIPHVC